MMCKARHASPARPHDEPESPDAFPPSVGAQPLPPAIAEALADPIVRALMAADGVDEDALKRLLHELVVRLAPRFQPITGPDYSRGANEPYGDSELS
jgi:hypothetical protein